MSSITCISYYCTFFQAVSSCYEELSDSSWTKIDASNTIDNIHDSILQQSITVINNTLNQPIGRLWTSTKE